MQIDFFVLDSTRQPHPSHATQPRTIFPPYYCHFLFCFVSLFLSCYAVFFDIFNFVFNLPRIWQELINNSSSLSWPLSFWSRCFWKRGQTKICVITSYIHMWQCKVVAMGETHSANKEPKKGAFIYLHTSIRSSVVKRAWWSLHPSIHPTKLKRSQTSAVRHPSFNCPALWRVQKTCAEKWSEMLWNSPPTAFPSRKCVPQSNFPPFAPSTSYNKL